MVTTDASLAALNEPIHVLEESFVRFNASFYAEQTRLALSRQGLHEHFLLKGWKNGLDPAPGFSTRGYQQDHPDVANAGMNPWLHYIHAGQLEQRIVHPSTRASRWEVPHPRDVIKPACREHADWTDLIDADWYHRAYPDTASVDAKAHYSETGWREGRNPNPYFDTAWFRSSYMDPADLACPLIRYLEMSRLRPMPPNAIVDVEFLGATENPAASESLLHLLMDSPGIDRPAARFSREKYLQQNPDIRGVHIAPEIHFYRQGITENRAINEDCFVVADADISMGSAEISGSSICISAFEVSGIRYRIMEKTAPASIVDQILGQAHIDPDVRAAGEQIVAARPRFNATIAATRNLIDVPELLSEMGQQQDVVIVLDRLQIGDTEKYAATLAAGLRDIGFARILVVTTDSSAADDRQALNHEILAGFQDVRIASLSQSLRRNWRADQLLALLLLRSRARHIFVIHSKLGLKAVANYGAPLSTQSRLYCALPIESPRGDGVPLSASDLRQVLANSIVFSDNQGALSHFERRMGRSDASRLRCLPPHVDERDDKSFEASLKMRGKWHFRKPAKRVLWASRWERFKAPEVLVALSEICPDIDFEAYGPVDGTFPDRLPENLHHRGLLPPAQDIKSHEYGAFVFTSRFEGMPNTILEMAALGLPIVASDVGGIRETISGEAVDLISMSGSVEEIAERFKAALDGVFAMNQIDLLERLHAARQAVEARHGNAAFRSNLQRLLEG